MTHGPPAGTSGHSTTQIGQDLEPNPKAQAATIECVNHLKAQKRAKEAKIASHAEKCKHNKVGEVQREAGDDKIISNTEDNDDEEPDAPVPEIPKTLEELISIASPRSLKGIYVITGLVKQSLSIDAAGKVVNTAVNCASNWIGGTQIKISASTEETFSSVLGLFNRKKYLPLMLFTSKSMQKLWEQPSSCPTKNISIPGEGNKIPVLNVSPFG
jgi:hypothetical protein